MDRQINCVIFLYLLRTLLPPSAQASTAEFYLWVIGRQDRLGVANRTAGV